MILVLDIETVPQYFSFKDTPGFENMPKKWKELWEKKAKYLMEKNNEDAATCYENAASIQAEFGKVIVIGLGILQASSHDPPSLRVKTLYEAEEKALLVSLKDTLDKMPKGYSLCAHNGREFDYPYLCRRFIAHGETIPGILNVQGKKPWDIDESLKDTMNLWKFGDFKHYTSLNLLCACLGLPSSKGGIDGSQIRALYYEKDEEKRKENIENIRKYCQGDVIATAQVYLRLKELPMLSPSAIENADATEA